MKTIRIKRRPEGAAPLNRRAPLLGTEIPLSTEQLNPEKVFNVTRSDLISALRVKSTELAEWWDMYLQGLGVSLLAFSRDVCELVPEPVSVPVRSATAMTASNKRS